MTQKVFQLGKQEMINMVFKSGSLRKFISFTIILVSLVTGTSAWASKASPTPITDSKSTAMTPPNTPQEMWARILMLMNINRGFVSKQAVEEVLDVSFTHTEKDGELRSLGTQFFHSWKQDLPGLGEVSVGMFEDPKKIRLVITWGDMRSEPNCLRLDQVTQSLTSLDWESGRRTLRPGSGAQPFWRAEDVEASKKPGRESILLSDNISELTIFMPNQLNKCVIGISAAIYP